MAYRIIYHPKAEAELDKLYADIAVDAGTRVAGEYVDAVITYTSKGSTPLLSAAPCGKAPSPA